MEASDARQQAAVVKLGVALATLGLILAMVHAVTSARASPSLTLTPIDVNFPNPISIGYDQPAKALIVSVDFPRGTPSNFALLHSNGQFTPFGSTHGLTDEIYLAAIRASNCQDGFVPGDLFFGTGVPGVIARLTNNGATLINPWVRLAGEHGRLRGGLHQDTACVAGGDLIVTTTRGSVWRVTGAGAATRVAAHVGPVLEGPTTVPNNRARYGPWAGKILAGGETNGVIYSINPATGAVGRVNLRVGQRFSGVEATLIVPPNQNFYGVDFGRDRLEAVLASQFTGMVGDVLVATEFKGRLIDVRWNGRVFQSSDLLTQNAGLWEGTAFAPVGLPGVPAVATTAPPTSQVLAIPETGGSVGGGGVPMPLVAVTIGSAAVALAARALARRREEI